MISAIILGALVIPILMALMISPTLSSCTTMAELNQTQAEVGRELIIEANELETRINKSGVILEITSKLPEVSSVPFASSIASELHRIPKDVDTPKRKIAQGILAADKDFELIFFLMPNDDMYLEEPYSRQENLTGNNFAFREYYKGAINTRNTYLGDVYISASSGSPQAKCRLFQLVLTLFCLYGIFHERVLDSII